MSNHTIELKLDVINHYMSRRDRYQFTAKHFGVLSKDVCKWVAFYLIHGTAGLNHRRTSYSAEFKISVVEHMQVNQLSLLQSAVHFNISSPSTILQWQRLYNAGNLTAFAKDRRRKLTVDTPTSAPMISPDSIKQIHASVKNC